MIHHSLANPLCLSVFTSTPKEIWGGGSGGGSGGQANWGCCTRVHTCAGKLARLQAKVGNVWHRLGWHLGSAGKTQMCAAN